MTRLLTLAAASLIAAPAVAGTYKAIPSNPAQPAKVVARDIAWSYTGNAFTGRTVDSRPIVLCQGLAKKVGRISSFTADGRTFSAAELAKCNGLATGGGTGVAQAD